MTEETEKPLEPISGKREKFSLSWKQLGDWFTKVWSLQRSVETLKERDQELDRQVARLQRQVDDQAGQLKVLMNFIETSFHEQIEKRSQRAALTAIEQLIAVRDTQEAAQKPQPTPPKPRTKKR